MRACGVFGERCTEKTNPSGCCARRVRAIKACGANEWTRTTDLLFTKQLLCRLSYVGVQFSFYYEIADVSRYFGCIPVLGSA